MLKNIPNALSLFRLALIAPFIFLLQQKSYMPALGLYMLAGITDGLDGWLARHYNWLSPLGSFIDPLADKLLIASSFISLALLGFLPWWLVILVFMRDATIALGILLWHWLIREGIELKPTMLSKVNTTFQLLLVTYSLFELAFFKFPPLYQDALIILTSVTTSASYIDYVWDWGKKAYLTYARTKCKTN